MKYAIVHDYLTQRGGAERVVLALAHVLPDAPIYTSIYSPDDTYPEFKELDVRTSDLQGRIRPEHFRRAVLRLPGAFERLRLSEFQRVLVSSSAFAHHIRHPNSAVYCYTPPHFLYDTRAYLGNATLSTIAQLPLALLRHRDRLAAKRHRTYSTISRQSALRIESAYHLAAPVIYPPLMTSHLPRVLQASPPAPRALVVSRLLPYKRIDVAIKACEIAGVGLTVVGEGPELHSLRHLATGDVNFTGRVNDDDLAQLFASHAVVLAPGIEDFGYGPVEANYAGRPVIAIRAGGALETVEDGVNGVLVSDWSPQSWAMAISEALNKPWSSVHLRETTERFSQTQFEANIAQWLNSSLE